MKLQIQDKWGTSEIYCKKSKPGARNSREQWGSRMGQAIGANMDVAFPHNQLINCKRPIRNSNSWTWRHETIILLLCQGLALQVKIIAKNPSHEISQQSNKKY